MTHRRLAPFLLGTTALLASSSAIHAQDPAFHASERGSFFQAGSVYADVWGDGDFAYVAHYGQSQVDILDVSNPANPTLAATHTIGGANAGASAQDVKVRDGLLFISLESGGADGVEIVDVRDPFQPVSLTLVNPQPGPYSLIHNTYFDQGWLYLCDSANPSIAIVDLRNYDPDSAPATITTWTYELTGVGNAFVHDITVVNDRLWVSAWDRTAVYDVTDLGNQPPRFLGEALGVSAHAVWPTEDGRFLVSTEERGGGALRLYEVFDDGLTVELVQRDSFASPRAGSGSTISAHNPLIKNDRVYLSNYTAGVAVLQIDRGSKTLDLVASFDTSLQAPSGFAGCWGVYPFLGEERVLVSDLERGLRVLDLGALSLRTPAGRPSELPPSTPTPLSLAIDELGRTLDPGSVTLHTRLEGAATVSTTMPFNGMDFTADLPAADCGAQVEYWFSAADLAGETFTLPAAGGAAPFRAWAFEGLDTVLVDGFESDLGWSVTSSGVTTGSWVRVTPVETGAQPGSGPPESSSACWVTANGVPGGSIGAADLDGGPTTLTSPRLDFSASDGLIRYSRWLFNDDVDSDALVVEVSNDDGASWKTVESVAGLAGGWVEQAFRLSDHVPPNASVRVRFQASDAPNNSLTEMGLDAFRAETFSCPLLPVATALVRNGSGLNPLCFQPLGAPVLGTTWQGTVDSSVHPSPTLSWVFAYSASIPGALTNFGELLTAIPGFGGQFLFNSILSASGGVDVHALPIPSDPSLAGLTAYAQALVFGGGGTGGTLCNALDLTTGR